MLKISKNKLIWLLLIIVFLYLFDSEFRPFLNTVYTGFLGAPWYNKLLMLLGLLLVIWFATQASLKTKLKSFKLNDNVTSFREYEVGDEEKEDLVDSLLRIIKEEKQRGSSTLTIIKRVSLIVATSFKPLLIMVVGVVLSVLLFVAIAIIFKR